MHRVTHRFVSLLLLPLTLIHEGNGATVTVRQDALHATGVRFDQPIDRKSYRTLDGPNPRARGIMAANEATVIRGALASALQGSGALSFWFRTDQHYRSGTAAVERRQKLVEIPETLSVSFVAEKSSVTVFVEWGGPKEEMFPRHIRIILPEFPGPAWHHFAVQWEGAAGNVNAFLDGTPYYVPGEKVAPLRTQPGRELVLHLSAFALADMRVSPRPFTNAQLRAQVGKTRWGDLDALLGAKDLGRLSAEGYRGKLLYSRSLADKSNVADWVLEGPGIVTFRDGWMEMTSKRPDGPQGHIVNWCSQEFPERFVAEWEFELLAEKGLCIVFFAAKGRGGRDLFDPQLAPRSGIFEQYVNGDIDCYHISYFANTPSEPRRVANLRKNSGFYLIANGPVGVAHVRSGQVHRALLIKDGAHIRMAVDGNVIIDHVDNGVRAGPAHTDGKIGFRQMQWTSGRYRNFRVHALR